MKLKKYREFNDSVDKYPEAGEGTLVSLNCYVLGLANESGELAGKLKKVYRDFNGELNGDMRLAMLKELGDSFWYLERTANWFGFTLKELAKDNYLKLADRQARGVLQGSGDNR